MSDAWNESVSKATLAYLRTDDEQIRSAIVWADSYAKWQEKNKRGPDNAIQKETQRR